MKDANAFIPIAHDSQDEKIELQGIPFSLRLTNGYPVSYENHEIIPVHTIVPVQMAFFTGMVTKLARCSEWWGQNETAYNHSSRVFIGDTLCYMEIYYEDETIEMVPLIFGLNVWNYELYFKRKENEGFLENYGGPFNEPFASDPAAAALLEKCLCLNEQDEGKALKYIMAVRLRNRPVKEVYLRTAEPKAAGVYISAMTFLRSNTPVPTHIRVLEPEIFYNQSYQFDLECLARRLYQFRDDIPSRIEQVDIPEWSGPQVKFWGSPIADLLTNVYRVNLWDMANKKVTEDGMTHTSSQGAPSFGCYIGMGTFAKDAGVYQGHIWTRDVGRLLIELCDCGMDDRVERACDKLVGFLYDPSPRFPHPNWKRIANTAELDENLRNAVSGKENDGHAAIMLALATAFRCGCLSKEWINSRRTAMEDAADWFFWQMDHPEISNYNGVLYSESEASTQRGGGYDLFSNSIVFDALLAFCAVFEKMEWHELADKCRVYAERLMKGIEKTFVFNHPRYGRILMDNTYDCWTYSYKRFALLFLLPDLIGYDVNLVCTEWIELFRNTYRAQKDDYFDTWSGRQMGYGQGYLTQICALLDEAEDFDACIEATASFCYHGYDCNYIVPEGVIRHGSGRYWFRNCDLGNAVQQAETIKSIRLILGIDDMSDKIRLIPRLPIRFDGFSVENYPVHIQGEPGEVAVSLTYERADDGYRLIWSAEKPVFVDLVRFGPFPAGTKEIEVSGANIPAKLKTIARHVYAYLSLNSTVDNLMVSVKA